MIADGDIKATFSGINAALLTAPLKNSGWQVLILLCSDSKAIRPV
jgi:hypothetical protein